MSTLPNSIQTMSAGGGPVSADNGQLGTSFGAMGLKTRIVTAGLIFAFFFGCLGIWSAWAPLQSGAVASGTVTVSGKRKTVQHLEGGIVDEILVKEGDRVEKNQVLVRISKTQPETQIQLLRGQLAAAIARESRLEAERQRMDTIRFPQEIETLNRDNAENYRKIVEGENEIFRARKEFFSSQGALTNQRIAQLNEEIRGLQAEIKALVFQYDLIMEEMKDLQGLVEKGFARKPRLLELRRQASAIQGRREQNVARVARARQTITETRLGLNEIQTRMWNETVTELRATQEKIADLRDRITAASDVLKRVEVRAPVSGRVVNLQIFTKGGVLSPGAPIMDIVPVEERLVVEARVEPTDIDVVHSGMRAEVRLSAYRRGEVPVVMGTVENVSADSLVDKITGTAYYAARVVIEGDVKFPPDKPLYPGMPADVLIVTGKRTALSYLVDPIMRSLNRSMREN